MDVIGTLARWLLTKAGLPPGATVTQWQQGRPYYPDVSHRSLVEKYIGWVYACANKNAVSCAQVPLKLYGAKPSKSARAKFLTKAPDRAQLRYMTESPTLAPYVAKAADVEEVLEHPFLELLANVNPFMNRFDLLEMLFLSLDITGNTFWYIGNKNNLGQPEEIWPQFTQFMKIIPHRQKFISHYEFSVDNMEKTKIAVEDMVQFKFTSLKNAYWGMGPLQACILAADLSTGMNEYETSLMTNRAMPDFAIIYPVDAGIPREDEQKRQDKKWYKRFGGKKRAGKPVHLYGGADIKPLSLSPKELNFLQGRRATLNEVAGVFGVPISKLTTEDVNRANAEAGDYSYMKDTVLPRLRKVEQKINEKLLPIWDARLFCAFDNPVPEDKDFQLKRSETELKTGLVSINEEREIQGMEPVPWGEVPLLPINIVPLGSAAAVEEGKTPNRTHGLKGSRRLPPLGHPTNFVNEPFVEELRKFFAQQRAEILAAFDRDMDKSVSGQTKIAEDYTSAWFDMQKWNRILAERIDPFVRYTLMSGGERALQQITSARRFDKLNPRVMTALERHRAGSIVQINDTTLKRIRSTLAEGITEGESVTDLRGRLEDQYDSFDKYKATLIARTETIWAWNEGAVQGWIQSGVVEKKQWVSSGDMRTCDFCEDMDGKIIGVERSFFDKGGSLSIGERLLDFSYESIDHPPLHPQCRCTVVAIVEGI